MQNTVASNRYHVARDSLLGWSRAFFLAGTQMGKQHTPAQQIASALWTRAITEARNGHCPLDSERHTGWLAEMVENQIRTECDRRRRDEQAVELLRTQEKAAELRGQVKELTKTAKTLYGMLPESDRKTVSRHVPVPGRRGRPSNI